MLDMCRSKLIEHKAALPPLPVQAIVASQFSTLHWNPMHSPNQEFVRLADCSSICSSRRIHWQGKLILPFGCDVIDGITIKKPWNLEGIFQTLITCLICVTRSQVYIFCQFPSFYFKTQTNLMISVSSQNLEAYHVWCAGPTGGWSLISLMMMVFVNIYDGKNLNLPWIECAWTVAQCLF